MKGKIILGCFLLGGAYVAINSLTDGKVEEVCKDVIGKARDLIDNIKEETTAKRKKKDSENEALGNKFNSDLKALEEKIVILREALNSSLEDHDLSALEEILKDIKNQTGKLGKYPKNIRLNTKSDVDFLHREFDFIVHENDKLSGKLNFYVVTIDDLFENYRG